MRAQVSFAESITQQGVCIILARIRTIKPFQQAPQKPIVCESEPPTQEGNRPEGAHIAQAGLELTSDLADHPAIVLGGQSQLIGCQKPKENRRRTCQIHGPRPEHKFLRPIGCFTTEIKHEKKTNEQQATREQLQHIEQSNCKIG